MIVLGFRLFSIPVVWFTLICIHGSTLGNITNNWSNFWKYYVRIFVITIDNVYTQSVVSNNNSMTLLEFRLFLVPTSWFILICVCGSTFRNITKYWSSIRKLLRNSSDITIDETHIPITTSNNNSVIVLGFWLFTVPTIWFILICVYGSTFGIITKTEVICESHYVRILEITVDKMYIWIATLNNNSV